MVANPTGSVPPSLPVEDHSSAHGLLRDMIVALERATGLHMSYDDLMGAFTGVHKDVPAMDLNWRHETHSCDFCMFAKTAPRGNRDCVRNKLAVNRRILRRREGLAGMCHLGLTDIVEPLIYQGRVIGVFYYGSVVVADSEEETRRRVRVYCQRRRLRPQPLLDELARCPRIAAADVPKHREALKAVVRMAHYFCETAGVRVQLYRDRALKFPYVDPEAMPYVVKETMHYVTAHLAEPFNVKDVASHLRCHPDFLSRKFKASTGVELSTYVLQARVDRAKRLMENPKVDIEDAALQSGFNDRAHFSKVFRRTTGKTPGEYIKSVRTAHA